MAGGRNKLTATAVEKRKAPGRMSDGAGLYLNIAKAGSKSWVFRYTPKGGKVREMGLGGYPATSLARAREKAQECREVIAAGSDPQSEAKKQQGTTFGEAADAFYKSMLSTWTNEKSRKQWKRTLETTCEPIRSKAVADIEADDVLRILTPIWQKTPETAARTRMRLERVLAYAKTRGWRAGENPAQWRGHLDTLLPARQKHTKKHHAAMPYADVPGLYARLDGLPGLSSSALQLVILTACRTSEALNAQWDEVDLHKAIWTIPAERMKARKEHLIPLSDRAVAILTPLYETKWSDYVFPGQAPKKPLSNMSLMMLLRRMKVTDVTVHGFRSSFRDWAGDSTSFPREIAEAALAHVVGGVEGAYRRGTALEKRRQLMKAWADYCTASEGDKVVRLRG